MILQARAPVPWVGPGHKEELLHSHRVCDKEKSRPLLPCACRAEGQMAASLPRHGVTTGWREANIHCAPAPPAAAPGGRESDLPHRRRGRATSTTPPHSPTDMTPVGRLFVRRAPTAERFASPAVGEVRFPCGGEAELPWPLRGHPEPEFLPFGEGDLELDVLVGQSSRDLPAIAPVCRPAIDPDDRPGNVPGAPVMRGGPPLVAPVGGDFGAVPGARRLLFVGRRRDEEVVADLEHPVTAPRAPGGEATRVELGPRPGLP